MLEFYVSYCTLPEIHRMYTEIVKQLQIFSDNLWAKSLRSKVYALFYVYAKKITQCFFVQKTATKSERSCYCSKEGMCISCFVSHMVKIGCFYKIQGCALSRVSCRVLNSWKSLEICPAIFQTWKIELKSRKMMKSHEFVSKLHQALYVILFLFWSNLIQFHLFAVHHEKSFVRALCKASVDHLFDNLESGKSLAQATVVQKMDSAIHRIYLSQVDSPIPSCCGQKCCWACIVLTFYFL